VLIAYNHANAYFKNKGYTTVKFKKFKSLKLPEMSIPKSLNASINPSLLGQFLFRKDKRIELFLELTLDKRIELLRSLTKSVKRDVLMRIPEIDTAEILQAVDPDEATDFLQILSKRKREKVLMLLSLDLKESISTLLEFDAKTAAGLMTLDYIQVKTDDNIAHVAKKFKEHEKRTGRPPVILVLKETGKLAGFLPGHELGLVEKDETIGKYVKRIQTLSYAASHNEVVGIFASHPHAKVAVLNDSDIVVGIIYSDDVLKLIQETKASTLYDFAGIHEEESVADSVKFKVKNRHRWLIINLGTAFLASFVVSRFESTLSAFVLLAVYMPIVAGMGGNAATQTLAVLVRGIALKQIEFKTAWPTLRNELGAGFINGIINGILVATVVIIVNDDYKIAFILALAMIINMIVAAFFGTLVPLIMYKLGKDPAASATIFITTATDVLGFLVFLGLATLILT
jgi:magnesium transporter